MEENKLPHSIMGSVMAWILTILTWTMAHLGAICGVLAVVSTVYSIRASRETIKLRKKEQTAIDDGARVTPRASKEPDPDI